MTISVDYTFHIARELSKWFTNAEGSVELTAGKGQSRLPEAYSEAWAECFWSI